ncbi:MAG: transcription elongation factor GreA [Alphaproteobacteria bacterium]|nr:transcription elongation factor GreA [Alphaproteobacteria bacterium]
MDKIPMTKEGYARLEAKLKSLKSVERPSIIKAIAEARDHGDLSENAEYHAARERQSLVEGQIAELEDKLARADVIDVSLLSGTAIKFGAKVTLADEDTDEENTYQLVGQEEADIDRGLLAITSPLARALIGKQKGESVEVVTPKGSKVYEIVKVKFG